MLYKWNWYHNSNYWRSLYQPILPSIDPQIILCSSAAWTAAWPRESLFAIQRHLVSTLNKARWRDRFAQTFNCEWQLKISVLRVQTLDETTRRSRLNNTPMPSFNQRALSGMLSAVCQINWWWWPFAWPDFLSIHSPSRQLVPQLLGRKRTTFYFSELRYHHAYPIF